jgi:hypothetical protein
LPLTVATGRLLSWAGRNRPRTPRPGSRSLVIIVDLVAEGHEEARLRVGRSRLGYRVLPSGSVRFEGLGAGRLGAELGIADHEESEALRVARGESIAPAPELAVADAVDVVGGFREAGHRDLARIGAQRRSLVVGVELGRHDLGQGPGVGLSLGLGEGIAFIACCDIVQKTDDKLSVSRARKCSLARRYKWRP